MTNIDPAGSVPALVTGKVQAVAGYAQGHVPGMEIRAKKEARIFWYADCGVNAVSNGIIVHNDMLKENPELIRSFVKASIKGFLYTRQHPDEAAAITKKFSEAVVPEIARRELEMSWDSLGDAQYSRQAAGMDVGQGLGIDRAGAQAVRRRERAAGGFGPVHQRVRSLRRRIRSAAAEIGVAVG